MFGTRGFQFHLSTIVLATLGAGVLIGANFFPHRIATNGWEGVSYGFPLPMIQDWIPAPFIQGPEGVLSLTYNLRSSIQIGGIEVTYEKNGWSYHLLAANVLLCALIVAAFAFGLEWVARKTAKK